MLTATFAAEWDTRQPTALASSRQSREERSREIAVLGGGGYGGEKQLVFRFLNDAAALDVDVFNVAVV